VTDEHGVWRTFGEKTVYDSRPWVRVALVDVEAPDGERWDYHGVHFGRIAVAMIVDEDADTVLMLRRYRFPTDQWGYELLGGLVEDGEEPAATAAREAVEESGWSPVGSPEELIGFEPLPGNVTAPMSVYLWRQAERVGEPTDTEEVGRVEWVPLARVPELARRGELLGNRSHRSTLRQDESIQAPKLVVRADLPGDRSGLARAAEYGVPAARGGVSVGEIDQESGLCSRPCRR
jgi:8-oxo-dGTP pyrophosphatase MutT (NUDIX family)